MSDEIIFNVSSGFGARTREGYVQLIIEAADFMTQMSPDNARELAINLLQCAEAAEGDAFLMTFMREQVKVSDEQAVQILIEFRQWRERGQS